jgi:predicted Holliday junction resolvase-like endonuclease
MIEIISTLIIGIVIGVLISYFYFRAKMESWKVGVEKMIRRDAVEKSRAVIKGKISEQIVPFLESFKYNPSDARFIGDPVDYIIFDGYTEVKERIEDKPITIVLADVKTGEASLTYEQRRIKQGVEKGLVRFEEIRI